MRVAVAGLGYERLSNAVLLAAQHEVTALDIDAGRVARLNAGEAPIIDRDISDRLAQGGLHY